ncbi:glycosyltransferase [Alphaproteobacteria bacterium]|nr:glycosyltransferase [Alphaproteobacteria bacterium]
MNQFSSYVDTPKVSWVICIHKLLCNAGCDAIQSCLDEGHESIEVIVVVNGPETEQIRTILSSVFASESRVKIFKSSTKGLGFNLAFGVEMADGDYIARLDMDDICLPGRLKIQLGYFNRFPNAHFIACSGKAKVLGGRPFKVVNCDSFALGNIVQHPSVLVQRSSVLCSGNYGYHFGAEDFELWVRMLQDLGGEGVLMNESVVTYSSVGVGGFRRHPKAYLTVFLVQMKMFLIKGSLTWLIGALLSLAKHWASKLQNMVFKKW